MAGIITLTFNNCRFTGDDTSITVKGGTIVLEASPSLAMVGSFPFNQLSIASGAISIILEPVGATFNGQISFPVNATSNAPTITVTNFSGAAAINWMSNSGLQSNAVPPGDPITLSGFQN